jgi:GNAT superfamily N-acetyltransferase
LLPAGFEWPRPALVRRRAFIDDPGAHCAVVEDDDGGLVAYSVYGASRDEDVDSSMGEVRTFFVDPGTWRGGVGTTLMGRVLAHLAELGYREASVWSFDANERANAFYERGGFTRDGARTTEEVWGHIPIVRYQRVLG